MIDTKKIIEAAERKLQGTDMFVVGCTCTPGNEIELLIDSDTSVLIRTATRKPPPISYFNRAMGVCDPTTGSPISTSNSVSFGRRMSMREPNLMNPQTEFCSTFEPTFI